MNAKRAGMLMMSGLMGISTRHPLLVKSLLRPLANAPLLSKRLMVLPRAFMGATAFEIHDVDPSTGRIGIGGVEEIMAGSKIIHLLHETLAARLAAEEKDRALYEMGVKLCTWEVSQALGSGRWAPSSLTPLIMNARILDEVREDPVVRRFFGRVLTMMSRLITDEGGWGHLDFDFSGLPLKVFLENSQEARWLGPSKRPVCSFYAGIVAGYAGTIAGEPFACRETACAATGAPRCVFELTRLKDT